MTNHLSYRADIDGLRAIAVLAVVFFHGLPNIIPGGFIGVDIFFVISGYLISSILMREHDAGRFSYKDFYARRIRRIFPALIIVLAFTLILGWFSLFADELMQLGKHIVGGGLFAANLVFWGEAGYFDTASNEKLLLHLWSLGIEEQFYIFWPIILGFIWKPRWALNGIIALFVLSLCLNIAITNTDQTAAFFFPISRFWELLAGALLAWFQLKQPSALSRFSNVQSLLGTLFLIAGFALIRENQAFPGYWALLPVFGSTLLISAGPTAILNRWLLSNKVMVWIGLISYPLYLWHWPVMTFIRIFKDGDLNRPWALRAIFFSVLFAWLTYRFVETPFRKGAYSRKKIAVLIVAMLVLIVAGAAAFLTEGYPRRAAANTADPVLIQDIKQQHQAYASDGNCPRFLKGIINAETPVCLSKTDHPGLVIMGDSHGMSFNMASALGKLDINAAYIGRPACLPTIKYIGYSTFKAVQPQECLQSTEIALNYLKEAPDVQSVVLISRGLPYFTRPDSVWFHDLKGSPVDAKEAFIEGYSDTISRIEATGKQVIFMVEWPELSVHPKRCIGDRLISLSQKLEKASCLTPRESILKTQESYYQIIELLAKRHPHMIIYNPIDVFCDTSTCYGIRNGRAFFGDSDHLGLYGSEALLKDFIQHFGTFTTKTTGSIQ